MKTYRIETDRLVLRPWSPADAALLKEAVDISIEHLKPWMPWAKNEPQTLDEKVELLRMFRGKYDLDQDHIIGIFNRDETEALGGTGFHPRLGHGEREIGYWVRADRAGQGIITESTSALLKVGFEVEGFRRLEIRCDPENVPSYSVARTLGFAHDVTLPNRSVVGHDEPREIMIWSLTGKEYAAQSARPGNVVAYDGLGRRLI